MIGGKKKAFSYQLLAFCRKLQKLGANEQTKIFGSSNIEQGIPNL
jgi:hypothetical protein